MQLTLQLGKMLKEAKDHRGIIQEIARETGLERHCVSSLVRGQPKYVNLEALGCIIEYLVQKKSVDARALAAELFAFEPNEFWTMLAGCKRLQFCLGKRYVPKRVDNVFIMASDSILQGALFSQISEPYLRRGTAGLSADKVVDTPTQYFPRPHLILSPAHDSEKLHRKDEHSLMKMIDEARQLRAKCPPVDSGLIALGSTKVNTLVEVLCAEWFGATPGVSQDDVASPNRRRVPLFFRYRADDVRPDSCCGGHQLSQRHPSQEPGIYFETEGGEWKCCACDDEIQDAAFLMYTYQPDVNRVELACGGFSSYASSALAAGLNRIATGVKPQYKSPRLWMGMYVVQFTYKRSKRDRDLVEADEPPDFELFPVAPTALERRLSAKTNVASRSNRRSKPARPK